MPSYVYVNLAYEKYPGASPVFAKSGEGFSAASFRKMTQAPEKARQDFFEFQLQRLANCLDSPALPVWIRWSTGEKLRMDKGCIGHSIARGSLLAPIDNANGIVEIVTLRD